MRSMKTDEARILACVSSSPSSRKLIHISSQMAEVSGAALAAVSVEDRHISDADRKRLDENIGYAKQLGAHTEMLSGHGVARRIAAYAKQWGATRLVLGRSNEKRSLLHGKSRFERELKWRLPGVEITTVPNPQPVYDEKKNPKRLQFSWRDFFVSLGIMAVTTFVCWWMHRLGFNDATLITIYILAVLLTAFLTSGYIYGAVSSIVSVTTFNFLFTVPYFSFKSYGAGYPVTLLVMFLAAFLTSYLTVQVKRQAQQHARNAYRTEMLLSANRRLQRAVGEQEILLATAEQIHRLLLRSVIIYPVVDDQPDNLILIPAGETAEELGECAGRQTERRIVDWVIKNNVQGGATTGVFDEASFWYLAVRINEGDKAFAVAGIRMETGEWIDPFDKNLLLAMLGECAVALEKERLNRAGEEYELQIRQEQVRSNLLRSISHDLRTPLTTISGNANMLMSGAAATEKDKQQLYADIYEDSVWLIDLVENLLSITRIDSGRLNANLQPQDLADILDAAAAHMQPRAKKHTISIGRMTELVIVNADSALMVQLVDNLIENAFKYAGEDCRVELSAARVGKNAVIQVADDGPGIPDAEKEKVFDMFYTTQKNISADGRRGLGLGLALCRVIAQVHGGSICVLDNKPHGATFQITLPALEVESL